MKLPLVVLAAVSLFSTFALAAGSPPVVAHTFTCTGNASLRIGTCPGGGRPDSLIQGSDGNFYGTSQVSNEGSSTPTGGNVFSLTPSGTFTVLHTFLPGPNKNYPNGNLPGQIAEGSDGRLYGYTLYGGVGGCNGYCGSGVLYRVNKDGTGFQIIHRFCSQTNCTDGGAAAVVPASDGNLYGASAVGGTGNCSPYYIGCGTIFRVSPASGYSVVVNFNGGSNGEFPSGLTLGSDGAFYGLNDSSSGGNLFRFTPSTGAVQLMPLNFPFINGLPSHGGDLTLGPNGNFYGLYIIYATPGEGVFEVHPDGTNLTLFPFYTKQEGAGAPDGLLLASNGNFLVANYNGTNAYGDLIELSPSTGQMLQSLSPFGPGAAVGSYPALIMQAKDGTVWGSTMQYGIAPAGQFADGTVFSLNLGLPPR